MRLNFNSPLMEFIDTTARFVALNIIFIICCLPIITIGPAIAALYQIILREVRGEHGYLIRKFFQHFKEMFVQSFFTFVIFLAIILILVFNITFWSSLGGLLSYLILILVCIMLLIAVCAFVYIFPLMARFENSLWFTIKNAFLIALANPKSTMILLFIHIIMAGIIYIFPPSKVFMLFIGFSFVTYCNSYILNRTFRKYENIELGDME